MDVFSHAAWGYGLFGQRKPLLAVAIGAMPDLLSFGIFFVVVLGVIVVCTAHGNRTYLPFLSMTLPKLAGFY